MSKNALSIVGLAVLVVVLSSFNLNSDARIAEAEQALSLAQEKVSETESRLKEQESAYSQLVDSLQERQDSLKQESMQAGIRAARLEVNFSIRTEALVDSLMENGDTEFARTVQNLKLQHDSVVTELRDQVATLQEERALLWARVEASDSLLAVQADVNDALRASVVALEASRDAWKAKALPSLPKRLLAQAPAVLTGAVLVSVLR
jgi:chromosome segregation ATPase